MKSKLSLFSMLLLIVAVLLSPVSPTLAAVNPQEGQPPQPANGDLKIYLPIAVGGNEGSQPPATPTATLPPGVTPTATATLPPGVTPTVIAPTATATIPPVPTDADLAVIVSVNPTGRIALPANLVYTITVTNLGPAEAANTVVTVTPATGTTFDSAVANLGTFDSASNLWTVGSLGNGLTATLTLTRVAPTGLSGTLTLSVSVAATQTDPIPANNTGSVSNQVNPPGSIRSDDFNYQGWDTMWTWTNPLGLATVDVDGSHLRIAIPAGTPHYVWRPTEPGWTESQAPRVLQAVSNPSQFEITAKFETRPTGTYAGHGIWVEYDENDFIRFEFFSYGANSIYVHAATIINGETSVFVNEDITANLSGNVSFLRLARDGSSFTLQYSNNGTDWFAIPGTLTFGKQVRKVGLYAATSQVSEGTAPAFTMAADYFIEVADPIDNEDAIHPSFIFSDDFNAGWNKDLWTKMNSTPAIEFLNFTSTQATMYVGTGVEHDLWDQNEPDPTLRVKPVGLYQDINDRSFDIEVKFDSRPLNTYAANGLMLMEEGRLNLIQFYFYSYLNGDVNQLRLYASEVVNGVEEDEPELVDMEIPAGQITGDSMLLRIVRLGNQYTLKYGDGVNWYDAKVFNSSLVTDEVAIVVGNEDHQGNGIIPGYTSYIDYFQNNAMPIAVHD